MSVYLGFKCLDLIAFITKLESIYITVMGNWIGLCVEILKSNIDIKEYKISSKTLLTLKSGCAEWSPNNCS